MDTEAIVETLAATPVGLADRLAALQPWAARQVPAEGEWSAAEIVAHLHASDAILAPRIFQVLIRPGAPLPAVDDRALADLAGRARLSLTDQLAHFRLGRAELVGVLRSLTRAEWDLAGRHEAQGDLTVRQIAHHLAQHEREHLDQLDRLLTRLHPTPLPAP